MSRHHRISPETVQEDFLELAREFASNRTAWAEAMTVELHERHMPDTLVPVEDADVVMLLFAVPDISSESLTERKARLRRQKTSRRKNRR